MALSQTAPIDPARSVVIGFLLAGAGVLMLPFGDAIAKYLAGTGLHPVQIAWGRWAAHFILLTPIVLIMHGRNNLWPRSAGIQVLRSVLMCAATVAYFSALKLIALADAAAVLFVAPLIMTALSGVVLGERVGPWRWLAVVIGFIGVLFIVRPGSGIATWGSLLALAAALCFSVYFLLTRKVAHHNPPLITLWFMGLVGTFIMLPLVPPVWQDPGIEGWLWITMIGAVMALGHLLIIKALQFVEASAIAPMPYLELITATALGFVWFGEFPGISTWIGCAIVIGAGLFIAYREKRVSEAAMAVPAEISEGYPRKRLILALWKAKIGVRGTQIQLRAGLGVLAMGLFS